MTALEIAVQYPPLGMAFGEPWDTGDLLAKREIVRALIDGGADVNQSSDSWLAIHGAVYRFFGSDMGNLELLIEAGANLNAISWDGTPLYIAATNHTVDNRVSKVQVLIDACVDVELASESRTALDYVRSRRTSSHLGQRVMDEDGEIYDLLRRANRRQRQLGCE